jgi:single stranded DNA-binding protein
MNDINTTTVSGRIVRDPISIANGNGCTFSLASNRSYKAATSEKFIEDVCFIDVTCWNSLAALLNRKLKKGHSVTVVGRLQQQKWLDAETGEKRSRLILVGAQVVGEYVFAKTDEAPEPTPDTPPPADFNEQMDAELAAVTKKAARRSKKAAA